MDDACDTYSKKDCAECHVVASEEKRCHALCERSGIRCRRTGITKAEYVQKRAERKEAKAKHSEETTDNPEGVANDTSVYYLCFKHWQLCDRRVFQMKKWCGDMTSNRTYDDIYQMYRQTPKALYANWPINMQERVPDEQVQIVFDRLRTGDVAAGRTLVQTLEDEKLVATVELRSLNKTIAECSRLRYLHWLRCRASGSNLDHLTTAEKKHLKFIQNASNVWRLVAQGLKIRNNRAEERSFFELRDRQIEEEKKRTAQLEKDAKAKEKEATVQDKNRKEADEASAIADQEKLKAAHKSKGQKKKDKAKLKKLLATAPKDKDADKNEKEKEKPLEKKKKFVPSTRIKSVQLRIHGGDMDFNVSYDLDDWQTLLDKETVVFTMLAFYVKRMFAELNANIEDYPLLRGDDVVYGAKLHVWATLSALSWILMTRGFKVSSDDWTARAMFRNMIYFFTRMYRENVKKQQEEKDKIDKEEAARREKEEKERKAKEEKMRKAYGGLYGMYNRGKDKDKDKEPEKDAEKKKMEEIASVKKRTELEMNATYTALRFLSGYDMAHEGNVMKIIISAIRVLSKKFKPFLTALKVNLSDTTLVSAIVISTIMNQLYNRVAVAYTNRQLLLEIGTDLLMSDKPRDDVAELVTLLLNYKLEINEELRQKERLKDMPVYDLERHMV